MNFDIENKGHITETGQCCFCGSVYTKYGNSTWGYWSKVQEDQCFGENKRCCDKCYLEKISPARLKKFTAMEAGIISSVSCDLPDVIFESTTRDASTYEGHTLRLYENGIYQKLIYEKADSIDESTIRYVTLGQNAEVVEKVKELIQQFFTVSLIDYINRYEEIKLNNPYDNSQITSVRFDKTVFSGKCLFTIFSDEDFEKLESIRTNEKDEMYKSIKIISRCKSEVVMFIRQLFGIEKE